MDVKGWKLLTIDYGFLTRRGPRDLATYSRPCCACGRLFTARVSLAVLEKAGRHGELEVARCKPCRRRHTKAIAPLPNETPAERRRRLHRAAQARYAARRAGK